MNTPDKPDSEDIVAAADWRDQLETFDFLVSFRNAYDETFSAAPYESHPRPAHVVRIIDGDTIETEITLAGKAEIGSDLIITTSARLYGINAPDASKEGPERTKAATEHLAKLIQDHCPGGEYKAELRGRDKYGRVLIVIYGSGVNINLMMVADGQAVEYLP